MLKKFNMISDIFLNTLLSLVIEFLTKTILSFDIVRLSGQLRVVSLKVRNLLLELFVLENKNVNVFLYLIDFTDPNSQLFNLFLVVFHSPIN